MKLSAHIRAQIIFYLGWVGMIFAETTLWSISGLLLGLVVFFLGGLLWAKYEIDHAAEGKPLHGPVLRVIDRLLRTGAHRRSRPILRTFAYLACVMLGGAPGVGLVLKKQSSTRAWAGAIGASAIYALTWALVHWYRPRLGVPFGLYPNPHLIVELFREVT
jgi:hypothetical protein